MKLFMCDFCKKGPVESDRGANLPPTDWKALRIQSVQSGPINFDACDECSKRLGFDKGSDRDTPKDELYDIFFNMIEDVMQNSVV